MTPSASTLRAVTLKTVANYTQAAGRAVVAYRVGGQRLIAAMQRSVDRAAAQGPDRLAAALRRASGNVGGLASKGLDVVSNSTERVIELSSTGVNSQVRRVADLVDGLDIAVVSNGLQAVARISLPGAYAALALSERVVAGADKLPGTPVAQASAAVRRRAAKVATPVEDAVQAVAQQAKTTVKPTLKHARKAAAPVLAEVVAAVAPKAGKPASRKPAAKPVVAAVAAVATRTRRAAKPLAQAAAAVEAAVTGA